LRLFEVFKELLFVCRVGRRVDRIAGEMTAGRLVTGQVNVVVVGLVYPEL
jgi:hypothetical protein